MTKTTEELKREMFDDLARVSRMIKDGCNPKMVFPIFEECLEEYLERLRQDAKGEELRLTETIRYNAVLSDAYTLQQQLTHAACVSDREAWAENHELRDQVRQLENANANGCRVVMEIHEERKALRNERDELRNKLQAFEFANKSAGDLLRDALATVKRQREFIRTLYTSRKARKSKGSTSAQSSTENVAEVKCDGMAVGCHHLWETVIGGGDVFCLKCGERA